MVKSRIAPFRMKKILIAVDGSRHSDKAVDLAVHLAKKANSEIYLIHVLSSGVSRQHYEKSCNTIIGRAEAKFKNIELEKIESVCTNGNPADEILRVAKSRKVDLIIMGNRGKGGLSKALMGSVSTKVCKLADCTCVTVK